MEIRTSPHFDKVLKRKITKNIQLGEKVKKQMGLLKEDINHPSLKLHKLTGTRSEEYSFWIEGNLRITFILFGKGVLLTDLITHDEY
ncbi:MAG: plasmid stabilization protein [Patescibacteria group bacterium]